MTFKENLLQKIKINKMASKVIDSIGPPESGRKVDRDTMRHLLELTSYTYKRKRDLDLFIEDPDSEKTGIFVLDNDLAIYQTSVYDVAMRKSPTVKEMMNPFNVVKILKDDDVVISKKEDSVKTIQNVCINTLDISFTATDLDEIVADGVASLNSGYPDGVIEAMELFAEILQYSDAPKEIKISHNTIMGKFIRKENRKVLFGPMVVYSLMHNTIKLVDRQIESFDREGIKSIQNVASGKKTASLEGPDVFQYLKQSALKSKTSN